MPSASVFLLAGIAVAVILSLAVWLRQRGPRSPARSVDEFNGAMRALAPDRRRRR